MLGHSGLPGVKANRKLSYQVGKSIKRGLNKTQKQQGRTTNVVPISGSHPCMGESQEGDSVFSAQRSSFTVQFSLQLAEK